MKDEIVDLINEQNQVIGQATRREIRSKNLLHRGVAILVENSQGEVYIHQRTATKDLFPSAYDMFVGGVVGLGESFEAAAQRELAEELGVQSDPNFLFEHLYHGPHNYSFIRVFQTVWDGPIRHQPEEVAWGRWLPGAELEAWTHTVEIVADGLEVYQRYLQGR
jgi:isopentenyldiphosphate isomerase